MDDRDQEAPPSRRRIPGEPLEEPSSRRNDFNGAYTPPSTTRSLLVVHPITSRPNAPVALAEGQNSLRPLHNAIPADWAAVAYPEGCVWTDIDWTALRGRRPVIIPENNILGIDRAAKLEVFLHQIGVAASVLPLPEGVPHNWSINQGVPMGVSLLFEQPGIVMGTTFSAIDLEQREFASLRWIIQGWLPIGLGLLVGPPKIGKSFLAMDFGSEISAGRPVFGRVDTFQTDVLYLALEDSPRRLADRMKKLLGGRPASRGLTFATEWPKLDKGGLDQIRYYLDATKSTGLIIIDTWAKVRGEPGGGHRFGSRKGVYNLDYDEVSVLHKLAQEREVCLLLLHHTRKQDATDVFDRISGSQGIAGAADTLMVLSRPRGDPTGTFAVTGRDVSEDGTFAVKFDRETCHWTLLGEAKEVKNESEKQKVYDALFASQEPMGQMELAAETGIGINTVRSALQRLKKRHAVWIPGHGLWGITGRNYLPRKDGE